MAELRQLLVQHPKGVTLAEIAAHLAITPRSARRYLRELPYELEAAPDRPGGEKRWRIPAVDLPRRVSMRRTQAYALLATRSLFEPMRGSTLYEEIALATQTLLGIARRPGRGPNAGVRDVTLDQRFRYLPFAPKDYALHGETLDNVFQAVADLRPLRCRYPGEDGELERRLLHPYAMLLYKEAIHCLALDVDAGDVRALLLDGMRDTRCLDDRFTLPDDFAVDDYVQGQFGIWKADGEPQEVIVDLDPTVAEHVATRRVHPSQTLEALPDGRLRLTLRLCDLTEIPAWILGFGTRAEVVAPASLREAVRRELEAALARYSDAASSEAVYSEAAYSEA
ncbi:MAG: WYL domain-containing transcriptional regulator, partial [Myxococcales bacterium]|nr:WYL domain-containing transcriptional regulator [Myxococcales bacterium]